MYYFPCAALSLVLVCNFGAKNRGMQKPLPRLPRGGGGAGWGNSYPFAGSFPFLCSSLNYPALIKNFSFANDRYI